MAFKVYHNPTAVAIGAVSLTGVVAIAIQQSYEEIHAAADGDVHESVARYTTGRTSGSIRLVDPVQAQAVAGTHGSLSFTWTDVQGAENKSVTIANCSVGPFEGVVQRDGASSAVLRFIAESAPVVS